MKKLLLVIVLIVGCDKDSPTETGPIFNTITFNNITSKDLTIRDNSEHNMFSDFIVTEKSTIMFTYECPSFGCDIDFLYLYSCTVCNPSCICAEDYERNKSYTLGDCPFCDQEGHSDYILSLRCTECLNGSHCIENVPSDCDN